MSDLAAQFRSLHAGPGVLRLVNAWDRLSARVFVAAGAPAIGTSSFAVALARGYMDGERIPLDEVVAAAAEIVAAVDVPVTVDIEAGYGPEPADVDRTVARILSTGAVGINLEDGRPDSPGGLSPVDDQCRRIAAARRRAESEGVALFVNARCDVYFGASIVAGDRFSTAVERLAAYVDAGADGVFVPGLTDGPTIADIAAKVAAPVNVMLAPNLPAMDELRAAGVRRLSQGGGAFLQAIGYLGQMTAAYLDGTDPTQYGGDVSPGFQYLPNLVAGAAQRS